MIMTNANAITSINIMKELELANKVLTSILTDDVSFKKALKEVFPFNSKDKEYTSVVSSLTGCELRHHLLFLEVAKVFSPELTNEEKNLLLLALSNYYFLKKLPNDEVEAYLKEVLKDKYTEETASLFHKEGTASDLLTMEKTSLDYISIRFNTPRWLIKMWAKHYGRGVAFRILKANSFPTKNMVRLNTLIEKDPAIDHEDLFVPSDVKDMYQYVGKMSLRKTEVYKNDGVFLLKPVIKELFDQYVDPTLNEYTLYSGADDSLFNEMIVRSELKKGINVVVPSIDKRLEMMRWIRTRKAKNINFFQADNLIAYQTGISNKQNLIVVNPISSSFEKIRMYPDYLLHFKREEFDGIIAHQKEVLNDMSTFVNNGGTILYIVDTMNKKETVDVVNGFIAEHPDFSIVEQRQIFPFEKEDASLYYAVMKMKDND